MNGLADNLNNFVHLILRFGDHCAPPVSPSAADYVPRAFVRPTRHFSSAGSLYFHRIRKRLENSHNFKYTNF